MDFGGLGRICEMPCMDLKQILPDFDRFGRMWVDLKGYTWIRTTSDRSGWISAFLNGFRRFCADLDVFGRIWTYRHGFGRIWTDLDGFGRICSDDESIEPTF